MAEPSLLNNPCYWFCLLLDLLVVIVIGVDVCCFVVTVIVVTVILVTVSVVAVIGVTLIGVTVVVVTVVGVDCHLWCVTGHSC